MVHTGLHEDAQPADTGTRFPGAGWGREFVAHRGRPLPASTTSEQLAASVLAVVQPWTDAGMGCVVSVKLDMAHVAAGAWDNQLAHLARSLYGRKVVLILRHEPENDTPAAVFVAGHNHAYHLIKQEVPALAVAACSMAYAWRPGAKETADPAVWAATEADIYLADVYFGKSFPMGILPEHPGWARWYQHMIDGWGRRWGLAEYGLLAGPLRAATIDRQAEWFATDPVGRTCEMVLVWGTGGTENNPGWLLDDDARAAVTRMFARLAAGRPTGPDTPTAPTVPAGYRASPVDGFVVSTRSGALVAADLIDRHDAFLRDGTA